MSLTFLTTLFFNLALQILNPVQIAGKDDAQILFAGDAMCHSAQLDAARNGSKYDFSGYYDKISPAIKAADFSVINLETPVSYPPYSGYPCFNAPVEFAKQLKTAGFNLFLTANNHTLDRRVKGGIATIHNLDSLGICHIGTYTSKDERNRRIPFVKNINGINVGFLNYTYGTNGFTTSGGFIVDYINRILIKDDIERTRAAGAELICVAIHWGTEYILTPDKSQKDMADYLKGLGVEMIIGGHPHVVQPMELENGRLTVYSLGNLVSNMKTTDTRGGALLRVTIGRNHSGNAIVKDAAYSLVFVEQPEKKGDNYTVVPCEKVSGQNASYKNRLFISSTGKSLEKRNRNVPGVSIDSLININHQSRFSLPAFSPIIVL